MAKQLLCALVLLLLMTSCSTQWYLERKEDRIIGAWAFEKVTYKKEWALFADNITSEYSGDVIEFFGDYTAIYEDRSLGEYFDGDWEIIVDKDYVYTDDGGSSDTEFFVDAIFFDFVNGEDFRIFGSIDRLNDNRLILEAFDAHGRYRFKLFRL